jgi:hypothetical protein
MIAKSARSRRSGQTAILRAKESHLSVETLGMAGDST